MPIKLFAGLGNPEPKYENTRHNFGFLVLDAIAGAKSLSFQNWNGLAETAIYKTSESPQNIYLIKPQTYMNNSGIPIAAFAKYYKINADEIFVFYDDFAIDLGAFKTRMSGSSAGHNGIKSIIDNLKSENFARMKLGIGPVPEFIPTKDFVLSSFKNNEKEMIDKIIKKSVELFDEICLYGLEKAISRIKKD